MKSCPLCGSINTKEFLDLGFMPLVNTPGSSRECLPLKLHHCPKCSNVFSNSPKKPYEIFSDYSYLSSISSDWVSYGRNLVNSTITEFNISKGSRIAEIACNDGYLLGNFIDQGFRNVLGIEPSKKAAVIAREKGITVMNDFFSKTTALKIAGDGKYSLVFALNVVAHVPDIKDFIGGIRELLLEKGVAVIQFQYMPDMIKKMQFDMIYHEHFSYLCLTSVERALKHCGLRVFQARKVESQGGSLLMYISHDTQACNTYFPEETSVQRIRNSEAELKVKSPAVYSDFSEKIRSIIKDNRKYLLDLIDSGKCLAGYGAAAKAVLFINSLGLSKDIIPCIADMNEIKLGLVLPGTDIPIVTPDEMLAHNPDYIVIFAWNLREEISTYLRESKGFSGKLIVFTPTPVIF